MKIGILVAMQKELKLLLPLVEDRKEIGIHGRIVTEGKIGSHQVALMQCGIGKVNAGVATSDLIDAFRPDLIINSGVAGGASADMHPLDVVMATGVAYHDVWCGPETAYGAAAGLAPVLLPDQSLIGLLRGLTRNPKVKYGLICSGDKFISKAEEVAEIRAAFPDCIAVDMESGAISQVATMRGVPFNVLRVISDTPGEADNIAQYEHFWEDAPRESFSLLRSLLSAL